MARTHRFARPCHGSAQAHARGPRWGIRDDVQSDLDGNDPKSIKPILSDRDLTDRTIPRQQEDRVDLTENGNAKVVHGSGVIISLRAT